MILVFTQKVSNSLHYILKEIFVNQCQMQVEITQSESHYLQSSSPIKIYYTENEMIDFEGHWVPNSNFLFTEDFSKINLTTDLPIGLVEFPKSEIIDNAYQNICNILQIENELKSHTTHSLRKVYFPITSPIGFDVFAHVFALIANIEETLKQQKTRITDSQGRFDASKLNFVEANMHLLPMADIAIEHLINYIGIRPSKEKKLTIIPTADVDQCYQFQGKKFTTFLGGGLLHPSTLADRIKFIFNREDQFKPSVTLKSILGANNNSRIFWLCNEKTTSKNKQISRGNKLFQTEITGSKEYAQVGYHPSFQIENTENIYAEEKLWLEEISGTNICNSRQHFLNFKLPETYSILEKIGITDEWSMGFAHCVGFRNGTTKPVKWYNILQQKETNITVHSFSIMDVTCKNYLKLNSFYANHLATSIKQIIQYNNGNFCFIIHNESMSEIDGWKNWKNTFTSWASNI